MLRTSSAGVFYPETPALFCVLAERMSGIKTDDLQSKAEYDHVVEMLEQLEIGDAVREIAGWTI
jgi:hypothetical protein